MRVASRVALPAALLLLSLYVCATAQQGDILFLDGKKYEIFTNPLEPFLVQHPDKRPKNPSASTSLWRGYVATWAIKDRRLVLTDVGVPLSIREPDQNEATDRVDSVMSDLFPGQEEVVAEWFTGYVIIPDGKIVTDVNMGYASTFEKYIFLRVERGLVTRRWRANRQEFIKFRETQFAAYKQTEEYRKAFAEVSAETGKNGGMTPRQIEEFLREFYSERYTSMIFDKVH